MGVERLDVGTEQMPGLEVFGHPTGREASNPSESMDVYASWPTSG